MLNIIKNCLVNSVRRRKSFLTQLSYDRTVMSRKNCCVNILNVRNNTACKRFCSSIAVNDIGKENYSCFNNEDAQQILNELRSNPDELKRIQIIELEIDNMRHNAEKVPTTIKPKEWLKLINMTRSRRRKYLLYLFSNEKTAENKKERKQLEMTARFDKVKQENLENFGMKYGLAYNTLFLRIYPRTMNHLYNSRLITAMMFEPKLVYDCGYEHYMNDQEIHNCAKQLSLTFAFNRNHISPMNLYFCNIQKDGMLIQYLLRNIPTLLDDDFPVHVTSQSYLDIFPKDQLVYLTPHCHTNLHEYDPDKVYILGGIVDKMDPKPFSLAKAKKEGIHMAKLPLEKYLDWGSGSTKNLTLNQVTSILLDINHTKDWRKSLQHVPTRKLRPAREFQLMMKMKKMGSETKTDEDFPIVQKPPAVQQKWPENFTFASRKNK